MNDDVLTERNSRAVPRRLSAALLAAAALLLPVSARADVTREDLTEKIQSATAGEMSLDELADYYLTETARSERSLDVFLSDERKVQGFSQHLSPMIIKRISQAGPDTKLDELLRISRLGERFVPRGTPAWDQLSSAKSFLEKLKSAVDQQSVEQFMELYRSEGSDDGSEPNEALVAAAVDELAEKIAAKEDPVQALADLAALDAAMGRPSISAAGKTVVARIETLIDQGRFAPREWPLSSQESQQFIGILLVSSPEAKSALLELFEWKILADVAAKNVEGAAWYFNYLIGVRADPNEANDDLRRRIVLSAQGSEIRPFAEQRVAELEKSGRTGFSTKLKFALKGYGSGVIQIVLACVGLLIVAPAAFLLISSLRRRRAARAVRSKRSRKSSRGYEQATDSDDEYTRLLAIFGLDDGATEAEIKRAFREAVKQHHPDAHGAEGVIRDAEGNVDDTFQELKRNYERLLEIRGGWFGRR